MGDFNLQKLPSRGLQTLWEWKNSVWDLYCIPGCPALGPGGSLVRVLPELRHGHKGTSLSSPEKTWTQGTHGHKGMDTRRHYHKHLEKYQEINGYPFTTFADFSDFLGITSRVL